PAHWATSRARPGAPSAGKRWKAFWRRSNSIGRLLAATAKLAHAVGPRGDRRRVAAAVSDATFLEPCSLSRCVKPWMPESEIHIWIKVYLYGKARSDSVRPWRASRSFD